MIDPARPYLERVRPGRRRHIIVHAEAERTSTGLRDQRPRPARRACRQPADAVAALEHVLGGIDLLLVMTVNPGLAARRSSTRCSKRWRAERWSATARRGRGRRWHRRRDGPAAVEAGATCWWRAPPFSAAPTMRRRSRRCGHPRSRRRRHRRRQPPPVPPARLLEHTEALTAASGLRLGAFRDLFLRDVFDVRGDPPAVARGILHAAHPVAPERIHRLHQRGGAGGERAL